MARILVIDDDVHLLKMLGLMLRRVGHEPVLANHGRKGIELALQSPPDLAIVDVMMPEISGHEVCRQLRAHPQTVDIPILVLTARSQPVDRDTAMESGATDYMTKPVSPKELAAKVAELLSQAARPTGRVVTCLSLRGGVGVTTMAVNLASSLRTQQVPNITLVDLSPNSGHIALQLRIRPKRTWARLLEKRELSEEGIRSLLIRHPSRISLLAAPVSPTYNASLSEKGLATVAKTLCSRAQFVIVDAPPILSPMCIGALKVSDLIVLVMAPDFACVQSVFGSLHKLADMGISGRKVHLLLNHPWNQPGLPRAAVERALKRPISFSIPFDPYQSRALAQGKPLSLGTAHSPLPHAMQQIARALIRAA